MRSPQQFNNILDKYHILDARNLGSLLPEGGIIDVTITSPPYWNIKDYGTPNQIGFGQSYAAYLLDLERVFRAVFKATRKTGTLWVVSDTLKVNGELKLLPFDIAARLKRIGWRLQDIIIWQKDRTLPWSHRGKLRNIFEYVAFYSKTSRFSYDLCRVRDISGIKPWWVRYPERYSPEGKTPARSWEIPIPRQGSWGNNWVRHANPLPPDLVRRILLLTTNRGAVVLDPFCGSGVVLAQGKTMGRRFIGTDLNKKYQEMFYSRVLPAFDKSRIELERDTGQETRTKQRFGRLIRLLRRLKFAKELLRLYRLRIGPLECAAIVVLPRDKEGALALHYFMPSSAYRKGGVASELKAICSRPPLSKYGIRASVQIHRAKVLSTKWFETMGLTSNRCLYVYPKGRFYRWEIRTTVASFDDLLPKKKTAGQHDARYPPVISTLGAKVDTKNPLAAIGI